MKEFLTFTEHLARKSGDLIRPYFRTENINVQTKEDRTIVTQADHEAEDLLRTEIEKAYPAHGIIGEEFGDVRTDAEFVWVLDPIDGTISFAAGVPLFGTLIGLLKNGAPAIGCIHQPILNILCLGDNKTTTVNGIPSRIRPCSEISDATLLITDPGLAETHQNYASFEELRREVNTFRTWGDCFAYLQLVTGRADIAMDPVMNPWDLLPLVPVVRGAGAVFTGWDGSDVMQGNSCIAAGPEIHADIIAKLN
ncbi:MAG: inositol monophosphatase family protein [Verrucomicrobiota bacterium]